MDPEFPDLGLTGASPDPVKVIDAGKEVIQFVVDWSDRIRDAKGVVNEKEIPSDSQVARGANFIGDMYTVLIEAIKQHRLGRRTLSANQLKDISGELTEINAQWDAFCKRRIEAKKEVEAAASGDANDEGSSNKDDDGEEEQETFDETYFPDSGEAADTLSDSLKQMLEWSAFEQKVIGAIYQHSQILGNPTTLYHGLVNTMVIHPRSLATAPAKDLLTCAYSWWKDSGGKQLAAAQSIGNHPPMTPYVDRVLHFHSILAQAIRSTTSSQCFSTVVILESVFQIDPKYRHWATHRALYSLKPPEGLIIPVFLVYSFIGRGGKLRDADWDDPNFPQWVRQISAALAVLKEQSSAAWAMVSNRYASWDAVTAYIAALDTRLYRQYRHAVIDVFSLKPATYAMMLADATLATLIDAYKSNPDLEEHRNRATDYFAPAVAPATVPKLHDAPDDLLGSLLLSRLAANRTFEDIDSLLERGDKSLRVAAIHLLAAEMLEKKWRLNVLGLVVPIEYAAEALAALHNAALNDVFESFNNSFLLDAKTPKPSRVKDGIADLKVVEDAIQIPVQSLVAADKPGAAKIELERLAVELGNLYAAERSRGGTLGEDKILEIIGTKTHQMLTDVAETLAGKHDRMLALWARPHPEPPISDIEMLRKIQMNNKKTSPVAATATTQPGSARATDGRQYSDISAIVVSDSSDDDDNEISESEFVSDADANTTHENAGRALEDHVEEWLLGKKPETTDDGDYFGEYSSAQSSRWLADDHGGVFSYGATSRQHHHPYHHDRFVQEQPPPSVQNEATEMLAGTARKEDYEEILSDSDYEHMHYSIPSDMREKQSAEDQDNDDSDSDHSASQEESDDNDNNNGNAEGHERDVVVLPDSDEDDDDEEPEDGSAVPVEDALANKSADGQENLEEEEEESAEPIIDSVSTSPAEHGKAEETAKKQEEEKNVIVLADSSASEGEEEEDGNAAAASGTKSEAESTVSYDPYLDPVTDDDSIDDDND